MEFNHKHLAALSVALLVKERIASSLHRFDFEKLGVYPEALDLCREGILKDLQRGYYEMTPQGQEYYSRVLQAARECLYVPEEVTGVGF